MPETLEYSRGGRNWKFGTWVKVVAAVAVATAVVVTGVTVLLPLPWVRWFGSEERMSEWLFRILGTLLIGLLMAGMIWKLRRDLAVGVVKRRDDNGNDLSTLDRSSDPAAFRRHVVTQGVLIGLMVVLALAVMFARF